MKKIILLAASVLLIPQTQAQDIILKTTGDEMKVKVTDITLKDIVYKQHDSLAGQSLTIPKEEVFMIKYANGTKEVITKEELPQVNANINESPEVMYTQGRADARTNYKPTITFWGSAASGMGAFFTMGATLAVPVVIAATPPKISAKHIPNHSLLTNKDYLQGYRKQAKNIRVSRTITGTVTGVSIIYITLINMFNYSF